MSSLSENLREGFRMTCGQIGLVRMLLGVVGSLCLAASLLAQTSPQRGVSGFYAILRSTELDSGSAIQLHLRLQLLNAGEDAPSARIVGFESNASRTRSIPSGSESIELPAHRAQTAVRDLTVSRKQYDRWLADSRQRLVIELQSSAGTKSTVVLALRRISGGNEE